MTRVIVTVRSESDRQKALSLVQTAAFGMRVEVKQEKRSSEQNDLMWARLTQIAQQVDWHGQKLSPVDWKDMFTASLRRARVVPNIDGDGFVQLGLHTSDLGKDEMSNLLDLMDAFAAKNGVQFKEQSNSSDQPPGTRTIAPAAADPSPPTSAAAGATIHEASLLSDDWRDVYITALTSPRDRPESLLTRHNQALQMIGGAPNGRETAWMRLAYGLVKRRNEGKLPAEQFGIHKAQLIEMELPVEEKAA